MIKLLRYMKKYWYIAIFAPIFMIVEVTMDMLLPHFMEQIVDYGITTSNLDNVIKYGLIMLGIVFIGVLGGILSNIFTNISCYKFGNDLRKDVFKKIMSLSVSQADNFRVGSLVTRVTNDITKIQNMLAMCLRGLIRSGGFFVLGIIFTLFISYKFGLVLAVILPIQVIFTIIFLRIIFPIFIQIQERLDKVNSVVLENVDGARVVKAFSKEKHEINRFGIVNDEYTKKTLFVSRISTLINPVLNLIVFGGQIVIYYIGGTAIITAARTLTEPELMVGQISQAITYITMICNALIMMGLTFSNIASAMASAKRVNEVLDTEEDLVDGIYDFNSKNPVVEFRNVSFSYPNSPTCVLNNITFTINSGETIAIVGSTGCGKSTLVNLIIRLYDVTGGSIAIDDIDIRDYKKSELRKNISICLQKADLFAGTINENISFGNLDSTEDEIKKSAQIAQAESFILKKDDQYNEQVLERGASLSGGQKQRLSIARAIDRKPKILIFDDSTSALDLITEAKLYRSLKKEMPNVTKIIVAQRIATAKNADRILVLDNGLIESIGTHDELMEKSNVYKDIYSSQLKKEAY